MLRFTVGLSEQSEIIVLKIEQNFDAFSLFVYVHQFNDFESMLLQNLKNIMKLMNDKKNNSHGKNTYLLFVIRSAKSSFSSFHLVT